MEDVKISERKKTPMVPMRIETEHTLGTEPSETVCPACRNAILTRVERKTVKKTHCCACCLCLIGGLLCVWIPYYTKCCRSTEHFCPECGVFIEEN